MHGTLHNTTHGEDVAAAFLYPKDWNGEVVLWLHPDGGKSLFGEDSKPVADAIELLENQRAIAAIDQLFAGSKQTRKVANPREFAGYTLGFNDSLFVQRTHDILTTIRFICDDEHAAKSISMVAFPGAGPTAAAARMLSGKTLDRVAVDTGGFSFTDLLDYRDPNFLPGGSKYGDLQMIIALGKSNSILFDPDPKKKISLVGWLLAP